MWKQGLDDTSEAKDYDTSQGYITDSKDCQQLAEAKREAWNGSFPSTFGRI